MLDKVHPDYLVAKADLAYIFAKLQQPGFYPTSAFFSEALQVWLDEYSKESTAQKLTSKQRVEYIGCKLRGVALSKELKSRIAKYSDPIVTSRVKAAIKNLQKVKVRESLWKIAKYAHLSSQGTSQVESLNSEFAACKPLKYSLSTIRLTKMLIGTVVLKFLER